MSAAKPVSFLRLALSGSAFHWRSNLAVFLGVAVSSGVLVGALLVGDSVRFSLRRLALQRIGGVAVAVDSSARPFDSSLGGRMERDLGSPVAAVLSVPCAAVWQPPDGSEDRLVNRARVFGVEPGFWRFGPARALELREAEAALGRELAARLGVGEDDEIALRVWKPSALPRDAPLASRTEPAAVRITARVKRVLGDWELGRFSLESGQTPPCNAFVDMAWLQKRLDLGNRANLLLVAASPEGREPDLPEVRESLARVWRIEDAGIVFRPVRSAGVTLIESEKIFVDRPVAEAVAGMEDVRSAGSLAYLVNRISAGKGNGARATPYSFMVACAADRAGALSPVGPEMRDDEMIVGRWLAGKLALAPDDEVTVEYYEFTAGGRFVEKSRTFRVRSVADDDVLSAERDLMPVFPGLSDVDECSRWDIGMPMREDMLADRDNSEYWRRYGPTPKAIVTLAAGQEMWGNRFGDLTAVRLGTSGLDVPMVRSRLERMLSPSSLGLFPVSVREHALKSVSEAMDFGQLFLGMSFFLIASSLMFTAMVFVLAARQRAGEIGVLKASGFRPWGIRLLFALEGGVVALAACSAGGAIGSVYTRVMVRSLGGQWSDAVAGTVILYHAEPATILKGMAAGFVCAAAAMMLAMKGLTAKPARELLSFEDGLAPGPSGRFARPAARALAAAAGLGAAGTAAWAVAGGADKAVPAFFAAGALLLAAGMGLIAEILFFFDARRSEGLSATELGVRNVARRTGRSMVTAGLLASGCFIVFAVSAMHDDPAARAARKDSGSGGYALFCEATIPVPDPLESEKGGRAFRLDDMKKAGWSFVSMKVSDGDDASCLNLNRARAPTLVGVDPDVFERDGAFEGAGVKPWQLLRSESGDGTVPGLAGDGNTAAWGLGLKTGVSDGGIISYTDERGEAFRVRLAGALPMSMSVFQGMILVPAGALSERYPSEEGYRLFLAGAPDGADIEAAVRTLSSRMARHGLDVVPAAGRLAWLNSVQSAYMNVFLMLGGLGLAMGTVGMGLAVFRNVMERRREIAVLACLGFRRRAIVWMVIAEHWALMAMGMGVGVVSAFAAVWPSLRSPGVQLPVVWIGALLAAILVSGLGWVWASATLAVRGEMLAALRDE